MKIGVVSDSHGDRLAIERVVAAAGPVDLWLHAGDCSQDASAFAGNSTVVAVAGNCDGRVKAKPDEFIALAGRKIWLTHGHRYQVKQNHEEIIWWARRYGVDIAVFGHTHVPLVEKTDGLLLVNPGSIAQPRRAYPTYAVIEISADDMIAEIRELK